VPPDVPLVFLIDALDRLDDVRVFDRLVVHDLAAVRVAGAGAVVASPVGLLFGAARAALDRFDDVLELPFVDVTRDERGRDFLESVVERRAAAVIPRDMRAVLVQWSGGVLRDLLQLSSLAVREAYVRGADNVEAADVERAVDALGRTLMLGLLADEISRLRRLQAGGVFTMTDEAEVGLVASRRVLARETGYVVHPLLVPVLS